VAAELYAHAIALAEQRQDLRQIAVAKEQLATVYFFHKTTRRTNRLSTSQRLIQPTQRTAKYRRLLASNRRGLH